MATQDQLVTRVLSILQVIQAGQTPDTVSASLVEDYLPAKFDELSLRGFANIGDPDEFPDAALQWIAMLVAQDLAPDFGSTIDAGAITLAERRLRMIATDNPSDLPVRVCYF